MKQMLAGALAMGFGVAALFFLRFWRTTRDRLFAFFSLALVLMALNRIELALNTSRGEERAHLYWMRFFAFVLILLAILDKNRTQRHSAEREGTGPGASAPDEP